MKCFFGLKLTKVAFEGLNFVIFQAIAKSKDTKFPFESGNVEPKIYLIELEIPQPILPVFGSI